MNRIFSISIIIILLSGQLTGQVGEDVYSSNEHQDMLPELSKQGVVNVGVRTITIIDKEYIDPFDGQLKPRSLKVEIWYPTDDNSEHNAQYSNHTRGGVPFTIKGDAIRDAIPASLTARSVVVLSHGYTGYRTIMLYLGEHLASHGYVVISIDHTDSTNEDVDPKVNPFSGFKSTLINRSRDQQFALDYFSQESNSTAELGAALTVKNAGIIGYSMGGYGAISTIGGCYSLSDKFVSQMIFSKDEEKIEAARKVFNTCAGGQEKSNFEVDPRWQAMVAFAPWGGEQGVFSKESINEIKVPSLYIVGNLDDVSGYDGIKEQFEETTSADSYLLTYINARHNIAPHPAPSVAWTNEYDFGHYHEPAWSTQQLNRINQHFALAMMDCYLQDDTEACSYLDLSPSSDQIKKEGKLTEAWKGFDHRYGTGMLWGINKVEE